MKRGIAGVALAAGILTGGNAVAAQYYVVDISDKSILAMSMDTRKQSGSTVIIWSMRAKIEPEEMDGEPVDYTFSKNEFDCSRNRSRITHMVLYRPDGTVMASEPVDIDWEEVIPESVSDLMLQAACEPLGIQPDRVLEIDRRDLAAQYRRSKGVGQ